MSVPPVTATTEIPVPPDLVVRDPNKLRWGIVSTIRAPLGDIARFAAFHLDLGAAEINVFLDVPDPQTAAYFASYAKVKITLCDDAYWATKPEKARSSHQLRQAFNASRCYRHTRLDWLAHIDVDEFLLSPDPIALLLAETPPDAAFARIRPAELLAQPDPWAGLSHFKLTRQEVGLSKSQIVDFYPEFGPYIGNGFLSYTGGKNIARTGLPNIRLGIHHLFRRGTPEFGDPARVSNGHILTNAHIGHAHAPSWEVFRQHVDYRMSNGSYQHKSPGIMKLHDVLSLIGDEQGDAGLRRFFDELCTASPALLASLSAHGMLLTARLDLDEKRNRWFPDLPVSAAVT